MEKPNTSNEDCKYMSVAEFAGRIGTHPQTVRRWDREGILKPHHVLPSGRRLYSEEQVEEIINKGIDMN
jgi:DNA-binding transcriptional MerR regulator